MPLFRTLQWSWFVVAMFYTYGDFLHEFVQQHRALLWLSPITKWNAWFSFLGYCGVFVVSVLTLKKGLYKYQACFDGGGEGGGHLLVCFFAEGESLFFLFGRQWFLGVCSHAVFRT